MMIDVYLVGQRHINKRVRLDAVMVINESFMNVQNRV
jgi:hypothetical protein